MFDVKKIKENFPIFETPDGATLHYLDSAASSQTPECVISAMDEYYRGFRSNVHRGAYALSEKASESYESAREIVAKFIGANKNEIIFTAGATGSANMLAYTLEQSLDLKEGDEIVVSIMEHHAMLLPLQELAKRQKLNLKYININENFKLDYKSAEALITEKTKIVGITLASNITGVVNDVRRIADIAHKVGALVVVDATAAVGHMPVSVKELDCDALFFSGHKMCGPTGIGALYLKSELGEKLTPSFFGGGIVTDVSLSEAQFVSSPEKFEAGTPNISGAIGMAEAVKYLTEVGVENIKTHTEELTSYLIEKLGEISGVNIFSERSVKENVGTVSFTLLDIHPHDVIEFLSRDNVAVRGGHHCALPFVRALGVPATVRASIYLYNTKEDIDALIASVKKAQEFFKK